MYNTKFILGFQNEVGDTYEVFFNFKNYDGNITNIYGGDDALTIKSVTSDDDKLQPILGTQAIVKIHVGGLYDDNPAAPGQVGNLGISIMDFVATGDTEIQGIVYRNKNYDVPVFVGFVAVEDNSQPLQDPPFDFTVRLTDGLGLLKTQDMVTLQDPPQLYSGFYSVEFWVMNILAKTGLTLNCRFFFPFYYLTMDETRSSLSQVYLNAITFQQGEVTITTEAGVDVFQSETDDAYTALTKIATAFRCRVFQENGVWNFVSLFSHFDPNGWIYNEVGYDGLDAGLWFPYNVANGDFLDFTTTIGKNEFIVPVEEDAVLYLKMANKFVKLNYNYDQSLNKICNQSLILGDRDTDFDETISSTIIDPTIVPDFDFQCLGYDLFCFDHFDSNSHMGGNVIIYPQQTALGNAFIREVDDELGYLFDRHLVLGETTNELTYLKTSQILVDTSDILQISFQWRTRVNVTPSGSGTFDVAAVYLTGTDGTFWALLCANDGDPTFAGREWVQMTDSNFHDGGGNTRYCSTTVLTDTVTWTEVSINQSKTVPLAKVPVSGYVEIFFVCIEDQLAGCSESWIKNINVTVLPYLKGTYKELRGDYNFSSHLNSVDIKQSITEEIFISDSPKRYFKGALLDADGNVMLAAWHRKFMIEIVRFTQFMERIYWNQVNRVIRKIEGTFKGFIFRDTNFNELQAGFVNSYFFTDSPDFPFTRFMLTSFEKNYATGKGRFVFVECANGEATDPFIDPSDPALGIYKFDYLFKNTP